MDDGKARWVLERASGVVERQFGGGGDAGNDGDADLLRGAGRRCLCVPEAVAVRALVHHEDIRRNVVVGEEEDFSLKDALGSTEG